MGHGSRLSKIVKKYLKRKSPSNIYQLKHTQHVMGMKIKCKKKEKQTSKLLQQERTIDDEDDEDDLELNS